MLSKYLQEAERVLEKIDTLHLEFAKRAAVSSISLKNQKWDIIIGLIHDDNLFLAI